MCGEHEMINIVRISYETSYTCQKPDFTNYLTKNDCYPDPVKTLQFAKSTCQDKNNCTLLADFKLIGHQCKQRRTLDFEMNLKYACIPSM